MAKQKETAQPGLVFEFTNPQDRATIDAISVSVELAKESDEWVAEQEEDGLPTQPASLRVSSAVIKNALEADQILGTSEVVQDLPLVERIPITEAYRTSLVIHEDELPFVLGALEVASEIATEKSFIQDGTYRFDQATEALQQDLSSLAKVA